MNTKKYHIVSAVPKSKAKVGRKRGE